MESSPATSNLAISSLSPLFCGVDAADYRVDDSSTQPLSCCVVIACQPQRRLIWHSGMQALEALGSMLLWRSYCIL